jgi:hypothetical protein
MFELFNLFNPYKRSPWDKSKARRKPRYRRRITAIGFGKVLLRIFRNRKDSHPAKPTSTVYRFSDGVSYRVWDDGSYRRMKVTGKRTIVGI